MKKPDRRLTDDEFEERARRNLERLTESPSGKEISYGDDSETDDVLASLDAIFDAPSPVDEILTDADAYLVATLDRDDELARRFELYRWAAHRYSPGGEVGQAEYERYAAALAARDRRAYRERIHNEEGREVRRILTSPEARKARRAELESKRYAQSKDGNVRRYNKLNGMTEEELAAYKREEANFRKAEQRAWQEQEKLLKDAGNTAHEIEAEKKAWKAKKLERKLEWERKK
ncbi:hypothetical protein [Sinorhizobium medicae]|uniref:hypothetical protein n=1 Tax=Sinorhizobium medicae TaxID=110321 RepID=UPI000FD75D40|nr:hypothetical protein [Sinorhizobium medicae]RVJ82713.1 hypothetical protein CN168_10945 [Sinorhizobium medicae]